MEYEVKIFYLDTKNVSVTIDKSDIDKFMNCIKSNTPFWDSQLTGAFFTPTRQVRYVQVREKKDEVVEKEVIADREIEEIN